MINQTDINQTESTRIFASDLRCLDQVLQGAGGEGGACEDRASQGPAAVLGSQGIAVFNG